MKKSLLFGLALYFLTACSSIKDVTKREPSDPMLLRESIVDMQSFYNVSTHRTYKLPNEYLLQPRLTHPEKYLHKRMFKLAAGIHTGNIKNVYWTSPKTGETDSKLTGLYKGFKTIEELNEFCKAVDTNGDSTITTAETGSFIGNYIFFSNQNFGKSIKNLEN